MTKQNPQEPQIPPSGRRPAGRSCVPAVASGLLASGLLACGLLAGCGAAGAAAGTGTGGQAESITLYSGQHEQTTDGLVAVFHSRPGSRSASATMTRTPSPT
jgi:hypothetical protein